MGWGNQYTVPRYTVPRSQTEIQIFLPTTYQHVRPTIRIRHFALALMVVATAATLVVACSVPVFRYALEHWQPDPYVAFVFYDGELSAEQRAVVESLQPESSNGVPAANVFVKTVDVATDLEQDEVLKQIWEANKSETLPWIVLHSPPKWGPPQTVWSGNLTSDNAKLLLDSPMRTTITNRLVEGESVVWVYLECGRQEEDDKAFALLTSELERLQAELELPEIEQEDLGELTIAPESLKIAFSALRLSKDNAAEGPFVEMLLGVEPDLRDAEFINQPMAFPIFGRGRALYALVGNGIAPDLIEEASQFLCGACQCTVKRENPGVDLLMHVAWDQLVEPTEAVDASLPPLAGFSGFGQTNTVEDVQINDTDTGNAEDTGTSAAEPVDEVDPVTPTPDVDPSNADTPAPNEQSNDTGEVANKKDKAETTSTEKPATNLMSQNVKLVLLLVVVSVVIATLFLMPRAS